MYLNPNFFDISSASEIAKFIKYLKGLESLSISRFLFLKELLTKI